MGCSEDHFDQFFDFWIGLEDFREFWHGDRFFLVILQTFMVLELT
jgi:ABC-type polysaccharide transport system permease subunit